MLKLKRKISSIAVAGLVISAIGTTYAADSVYPSAGAEGGEAWGKVTYMFSPSAAELAAKKSGGSYTPTSLGGYKTIQPAQYLFPESKPARLDRTQNETAFPTAYKEFLS